ncbi:MAG: phospholipase D-like domain-containing protein, partial [Candidatus Omnitrophota bacterium]
RRISAVIALICLVLVALAPTITPVSAAETHPAQVLDISDRAYEPAVISLIDNAKESIVISMYRIVPSEKGPMARLMKDLEEALERGVSVEIYLNADFPAGMFAPTLDETAFKRLEEKGAKIDLAIKNNMLHDKLVIVDSRYIAEGSHNWSAQAFKRNFESSTLIDSPALAREKLSRVRALPLEKDRLARQEKLEELRNPPPLPEDTLIPLPKALLEDKNLLPRLFSKREKRAFDAYFLVILRGYTVGRGALPEEFPVSVDKLADELEFPKTWAEKKYRWHAVTEILRKLRDKYGLIEIEPQKGIEEWVSINKLPGDTFPVGLDFFKADSLNSRKTVANYVYLIKALLKEEGKTIDSYTREELAEKYHMPVRQLYYGLKELK